jgi:hypothetical protein
MDFNFKKHGDVDVTSIIPLINTFDWDEYTFRQNTFKPHAQTKSIRLIWDEVKENIIYYSDYPKLKPILDILSNIFKEKIGPGMICNAILVKMENNTSIDRHKDDYIFFKQNNRMHIPITTNNNCIFEVDGEKLNMKVGEIWEINNYEKEHSVVNEGNTNRIHLIVDWSNMFKSNKSLL